MVAFAVVLFVLLLCGLSPYLSVLHQEAIPAREDAGGEMIINRDGHKLLVWHGMFPSLIADLWFGTSSPPVVTYSPVALHFVSSRHCC